MAVQYTSGIANIRSKRLCTWCSVPEGGRRNTVSAFSRESQFVVRRVFGAWKLDKSGFNQLQKGGGERIKEAYA